MAKTGLEDRLEAISREFVQRIVAEIRSASFAEVAGFAPAPERHAERAAPSGPSLPRKANRVVASPKRTGGSPASSGERQTAEKRAELGERVIELLKTMGTQMNARALSNELGVSAEVLVLPLLELRQAGRIAKHGEKRATTYSLP